MNLHGKIVTAALCQASRHSFSNARQLPPMPVPHAVLSTRQSAATPSGTGSCLLACLTARGLLAGKRLTRPLFAWPLFTRPYMWPPLAGLLLAAAWMFALLPNGLAADPPRRWIPATAYAVPFETAPEGEGYFSIIEGHNQKLYIGTHANAVNSYLVEFDPQKGQMRVVVDAHQAIGKDLRGFAAQSKIHTRNNVGASGKIYFGTKQGYPTMGEKWEDYPGGYPMVYDPATGETKVYPIPVPHHGIISITPDESRGVAYLSTCSDERPLDSTHFVILDLATGTYRDLLDCKHMYAFIVVDYKGRAYHPIAGGEIARYDPNSDRLERLRQTIDGAAPTPESMLALPETHPINWDISPDGKTLFAVPMSCNLMFSYDLTAEGNTLPGRTLGPLVPEAKATDCRALCVGPTGEAWAAVTSPQPDGVLLLHLVRYRPGAPAPECLGPVAISNPDYTAFTDAEGKPLPFHHGVVKLSDGTVTTRDVNLGICQAKSGAVYMLALCPYTLLEVKPENLPR